MRDKYAYVPGTVPGNSTEPLQRLAIVHQYLRDFFSERKMERKQQATQAVTDLQTAITSNQHLVNAFRAYEKAHLAIGDLPQPQLEIALRDYVSGRYNSDFPVPVVNNMGGGSSWAKFITQAPRVQLAMAAVPNRVSQWNVNVTVRQPQNAPPLTLALGCVFAGSQRFTKLMAQPMGALNEVCIRREQPNQHYIRYQSGSNFRFLRRYVVRGLNQSDSARLHGGLSLVAPNQANTAHDSERPSQTEPARHNVLPNAVLTIEQQILSHTRGWQKRFVSTTTTNQPVYSTRGEQFRSVFGKVIIDLAFVPAAQIYDLHTPSSLEPFKVTGSTIHNREHVDILAQRTLLDEQALAARDVIRTREVLIHLNVPFNAVHTKPASRTVIAIRHPGNALDGNESFTLVEAAWTGLHPFDHSETLSYRWNGNWWYRFYQFASPAAANLAWAAVPPTLHPRRSWFHEFDFPTNHPVGFDRV